MANKLTDPVLRERIMVLILEDPGGMTVDDLAHDLKAPKRAVTEEVHRMTQCGLVAPRLYRFHHAVGAGRIHVLHSKIQAKIITAIRENGPLSADDLARLVGEEGTSGGFKRACRDLHDWAEVSPPAAVWPASVLTEQELGRKS